jgi:hypothetical protein
MRPSILLILLIGFGVIFMLRLRQRLALLAEQVRRLRAQALARVTYTAALPSSEHDALLAGATREAEGLGFTMLGDFREASAVDSPDRLMRWFADAAGTTFGWMSPFEVAGQRHVVVVLMSHELDSQVITTRQPAASLLSRPPFVDLVTVPPATSLTETLARHRKRATPDRALVPATSAEAVFAEVMRMRDQTAAWRKAQPAGELLDADLKSLLGAQYGKLAEPLRRRLVD